MTREEARQRVNALHLRAFDIGLHKDRNGKYVCPVCGSGDGPKGTSAFEYYEGSGRGSCFAAGCPLGSRGSDNLGILRLVWDCSENDALARAGFAVDGKTSAAAELAEPATVAGPLPYRKQGPAQQQKPRADLSDYFSRCRAQLDSSPEALAYLARRGISRETWTRYGIGFDAQSRVYRQPEPRLIIPTNEGGYDTRAIQQSPEPKYSPKGYPKGIANAEALYSGAPAVFVVEGAFDAMSIAEAGAAAVSLSSANNYRKLIKLLEQRPTESVLLLCLDNDEGGAKELPNITKALAEIGARFAVVDVCGDHKDANEALTADREAFRQRVQLEQTRAAFLPIGKEAEADRPGDQSNDQPNRISLDSTADLLRNGSFSAYLQDAAQDGELVTGFARLDEIMCGWHSGLHVIGGSPGAGKTALALQLCDGIAAAGRECLYYSLEVPTGDMIARSLSRATIRGRDVLPIGNCETDWAGLYSALDVIRGKAAGQLDKLTAEYLQAVGGRVHIIDAKMTTAEICDTVRTFTEQAGRAPCVFVDYLQLVAQISADTAQDARAATDTAVEAFTQLAKELKTHVFVISSLNRMGYDQPADMSFFKESGGVEYSACTAMILQPALVYDKVQKRNKKNEITGMRPPTTLELDKEKQKQPRSIDLSILKSRYGKGAGSHLRLEYYSRCDYFRETIAPTSAAAELAADQSDDDQTDDCAADIHNGTGGGVNWRTE